MSDNPLINLAREFAILDREKRLLKERLDQVQAQLDVLGGRLSEGFIQEDIGPIRLKDLGVTVYLHKQLWARPLTDDPEQFTALCAALESNGVGFLVKPAVNMHSFSAWAREKESCGEVIPADIASHAKISYDFSIRTKKSS